MSQDIGLRFRSDSNNPGMHALVIGVSAYNYLPNANEIEGDEVFQMRGLASPALTACRIGEWLMSKDTMLEYPLKSLRLLSSPDPQEVQAGHPENEYPLATRENIQSALRRWREDARNEPEGSTFFYFGGHGLRGGSNDAIMLADDFLEPDWTYMDRTFRFVDLVDGMAPNSNQPNISKVQFYFVDCCRNDTSVASARDDVVRWTFLDRGSGPDLRARMAYFATVDGGTAGSRNGKPTYFGEMLLEALNSKGSAGLLPGQPGKTPYPVTGSSLNQFFERRRRQIGLNPIKVDSNYGRDGKEEVLCWIKTPPPIDITFVIADPDLKQDAVVNLNDSNGMAVTPNINNHDGVQHFKNICSGRYEIIIKSLSNKIPDLTFGPQFLSLSSPDPWHLDLNQAVPLI